MHKRTVLIAVAILAATTAATLTAIAWPRHGNTMSTSGTVPEWRPRLDAVIERVEGIQGETSQQQPFNAISAELQELYDAKLYVTFHAHLALLASTERTKAVEEQREWLDMRRRTSSSAADNQYERSGSGWSGACSAHMTSMTTARIRALETRMKPLIAVRESDHSP